MREKLKTLGQNSRFQLKRPSWLQSSRRFKKKLKHFEKKLKGFEKTQEFRQKTQGILPETQESANSELVNNAEFCPKKKPA